RPRRRRRSRDRLRRPSAPFAAGTPRGRRSARMTACGPEHCLSSRPDTARPARRERGHEYFARTSSAGSLRGGSSERGPQRSPPARPYTVAASLRDGAPNGSSWPSTAARVISRTLRRTIMKSPLATLKDKFGDKAKLVAELEKLTK